MKKSSKLIVKLLTIICVSAVMLYLSDITLAQFKSILILNFNPATFFLVTTIFILNFYIVVARLYLSYRQFNIKITYDAAKDALIAGYVGGIIPIFGAAFGQALNLRDSSNVSSVTSSFIYFYERIVMASAGALLCLLAGFYAFFHIISFTISHEQISLLEYCAALAVVMLGIIWRGLYLRDKLAVKSYISLRNILYVFAGLILSILSWGLAASSFVVCIYFATQYSTPPDINYVDIFCASLIVSFIASLPFSVNGWGLREFAAVSIFSLMMIPQEVALVSSISVGMFSLVSLLIIGLALYIKKEGIQFKSVRAYSNSNFHLSNPIIADRFQEVVDKKIIYLIACLSAIFLFFQFHFSLDELKININVADIFASCGFIVLLLHAATQRSLNFRLPYIKTFVRLAAAAFSVSLAIGYFKFGFSGFAFFSKFIGFFILIGYAAIGAMYINLTAKSGFEVLQRLMTTVLACLILFQLGLHVLFELSSDIPSLLPGYAGNRNAFAMQILAVLCLQLAMPKRSTWLISFFLMALVFTFSRSGIVTAALLLLALKFLNILTLRELKDIAIKLLSLFAIGYCLEIAADFALKTILLNGLQSSKINTLYTNHYLGLSADKTRLYLMQEPLKLWLKNPLFGIGLGGFINHEITKHGAVHTIHNSYLWFLTEFGIAGATVFFWYGVVILRHLQQQFLCRMPKAWSIQDKLLINLVIVFGLMACMHEVFYQRIFWFFAGMALVMYGKAKPSELTLPQAI